MVDLVVVLFQLITVVVVAKGGSSKQEPDLERGWGGEKERERDNSPSNIGPEVFDLFLPGRSYFITWGHQQLHPDCVCACVFFCICAPAGVHLLQGWWSHYQATYCFYAVFLNPQWHIPPVLPSIPPPSKLLATLSRIQGWVLLHVHSQQETTQSTNIQPAPSTPTSQHTHPCAPNLHEDFQRFNGLLSPFL